MMDEPNMFASQSTAFGSLFPPPANASPQPRELQDVINGVVALSPYGGSNGTSTSTSNSHPDGNNTSSQPVSSPETRYLHSSSSYSYDSYIPTPTPASDADNSDLSTEEVIDIYYSLFHHRHPILPSKNEIRKYIETNSGAELLQVMGFVAYLLASVGPPSLDDLLPRLHVIKTHIDKAPEDLIKVQSSIILCIAAHLSTDNQTSISLRTWAFDLCHRVLSGFSLSSPASDRQANNWDLPLPLELLSSWRTQNIDKPLFSTLFCRVIHEIFFLDIMFAIITRGKLSPFTNSNLIDIVPIADVPGFAFRSRYRTMKVVREIMTSLTSLGSGIHTSVEFTRLEALVTTFQAFLTEDNESGQGYNNNNDTGFPPFMDEVGSIDDGIHQCLIMINFAAILLHMPFSSLYQNKLPSFVQCTEESAPLVSAQRTLLSRQRVVVSTRQCISAANHIVKIVTDIGAAKANERTPLYTCSLAMAMLVHMKAYHWLTRPGANGAVPRMDEQQRTRELGLYEAYVKLESSTLQLFASRWILPAKLNASLCNVMFTVMPELYESVVESAIRPKRKAEDGGDDVPPAPPAPLLEKNCWMKTLEFDEAAVSNKPTLDIFDQLFDLDRLPAN